ncbi:MAG TPA: hydroxyacylglutathione hydrolase, partial [Actinobacteria bacterium]|nr:hydroxyacylglutathione hydrolase [Actinomycetota bacterium]
MIAVIGGGASGTLATITLLREAAGRRLPLRVALIDRHGRHGLGRAYSTTHPAHLLNSPVGAMSALADDPGHLTRWAAQAGLPQDGFLPRSAYGRYLTELLAAAERSAQPAARVSRITSQVVAIRRGSHGRALRLHLAADGRIDADAAVLATGNLPPVPPCPVPQGDRYIADPWEPGALDAAPDGSPVVVLGTGLTMLDVAIALTDAHPRTTVHAISRHALLPREHNWPRPAAAVSAMPVIRRPGGTLRITRLIRDFRASAAAYPGDWQDIVDALRLQIPRLWEQLPEADK